ncbi:hypothetical protein [Paraburkholderia sp. UCT70]|uniref:hypothetical protein n=1 Tax=Paraburkholderia sp. UCT70 TaxID=2991068 RepID=UPI003D22738E
MWTAKFDGNAHDGRYTLQKLLQVNGVSDLLRAKLHVSLKTISHYRRRSKAPSLRMLLAIASGFNQPLHDVLVGYLHWNSEYTSANGDPKISDRTDWTAIEREFEMLVDSCMFNSLEKACEKLKISPRLVRKHLPDLVARIDSRARELKSNWAAERRQERLTVVRIAFRTLVEAGEYPSFYKLQKITGVDARLISGTFKELIDEEWLRAEATTDLKRNFHHQSRCSNNT